MGLASLKKSAKAVVVLAVVTGAAGSAMSADSYTATVIPPLAGGTGTNASGVNNAGVVVGQGDDANGNVVPFVYEEGATTALPLLSGYTGGQASSVNTAGVIVGHCTTDGSPSRAVKWEKVGGSWTVVDLGTLDPANGGLGVATRINDSGQIVGYSSWASVGGYHATKWDGATKTDLGTLSYTGNLAYSQALGISNMGWITGYAYRVLGGPEHGLSIAPGGRAEDVTPQEQFGLAQWHNVNDSGTLVGYVNGHNTLGTNDFTPALYVGGQGYTLIPFINGLQGGYAHDINNAGVAIGEMFVLNPVPEPNVFAAFKYENGATADLNMITTGLPGVMEEAKDISENGLIVGTAFAGVPTAVLLTPVTPPSCAADFDGQAGLSVQDIFAFLNAWFAGEARADFNHMDGLGVQDIFDFLGAWFEGCH